MKLDNLVFLLSELQAGQSIAVAANLFAELFPSGRLDDIALEAARAFALANGCQFDHLSRAPEVLFTKRSRD